MATERGTILVTGASGFLGREIVKRLLERGMSVRGADIAMPRFDWPKAAKFMHGDLVDPAVAARAVEGVRAVIHSAAVQFHTEGCPRFVIEPYFQRNPRMTQNLLEAARAAGAGTFVFVSSDMVYGPPNGRGVLREDAGAQPVGPYGRSKVASEALCAAARGNGLAIAVLRPSVIIGPGRLGILQKLFDQIRENRRVLTFGPGDNRHHMIYVGDIAEASILAVERGAEGEFNIGSDDPPTVRAMLEEICRRAKSRSRLFPLPVGLTQAALATLWSVRLSPMNPEQFLIAPEDYVLDTSRAKETLGWRPTLGDTDAMYATYEWYVSGAAS